MPFRNLISRMFGRKAKSESAERRKDTPPKSLGQQLAEKGYTREKAEEELYRDNMKNRGMSEDLARKNAEQRLKHEFDLHIRK